MKDTYIWCIWYSVVCIMVYNVVLFGTGDGVMVVAAMLSHMTCLACFSILTTTLVYFHNMVCVKCI